MRVKTTVKKLTEYARKGTKQELLQIGSKAMCKIPHYLMLTNFSPGANQLALKYVSDYKTMAGCIVAVLLPCQSSKF